MTEPSFNYIITIHNKENLIHNVLVSTLLCCGPGSVVYAVLDGCTDKTEQVLDRFTQEYQDVPLIKLYAPDVHEIRSINTGLRAASQDGDGYNIILQDDVVLADLRFEEKVKRLYDWGRGELGFVSFRMGANLGTDLASTKDSVPMVDYIENAYGHGIPDHAVLLPGRFAYRTVPIKSPVCVPKKVVRELGLMNEELAPYMHDDTDLAIRTTAAGYKNGVFALRYYSDVRWGGTRSTPHPEMGRISDRNLARIREKYARELLQITQTAQRSEVVGFPEMFSDELDKQATDQFEKAQQLTSQLYFSRKARLLAALKRVIRKF